MGIALHPPLVLALLLEGLVVVRRRTGHARPHLPLVEDRRHLGAMIDTIESRCGGQEMAHPEVAGVVGVLLAPRGVALPFRHRSSVPLSGPAGAGRPNGQAGPNPPQDP